MHCKFIFELGFLIRIVLRMITFMCRFVYSASKRDALEMRGGSVMNGRRMSHYRDNSSIYLERSRTMSRMRQCFFPFIGEDRISVISG